MMKNLFGFFATTRLSPRLMILLTILLIFASATVTAFMQNLGPEPLKPNARFVLKDKRTPVDKDAPQTQTPIAGLPNAVTVTTYPFTSSSSVALEAMSSGTTQISISDPDDGSSPSLSNIGFEFWYDGVRFTQFGINANGFARLGALPSGSSIWDNSLRFAAISNAPKIAPYFDDLWIGSNGKVHFKTIGSAPTRKLVVEWRNMQIPRTGGVGLGAGTFQMWLYETTGVIEFVYGSGMVANPDNGGYSVGLQSGAATNFASVTTAGPTVSYATANNTQANAIASGTRYTFTPPVPSAPTGLNFTSITTTGMTLNWTDNSSNERGFVIYRSTDGVTYSFITQVAAGITVSTQSGLAPGTAYFWQVYAVTEGALSTMLAGSQATNVTATITSTGSGNWDSTAVNAPWPGGVVPTATDNVVIADGSTVTVNVTTATCLNLTIGQGTSGTLQYLVGTASTLTVNGNATVTSGGSFTAGTGLLTTHVLNIGGNTSGSTASGSLTVNGTFDMNTTAGVTTNFFGSADGTLSGTGATCDFFAIVMNKGTTITPVLDVTRVITMSAPTTTNGLTISNGTFKLSSASSLTPYGGAQTICAATGRLWINHASASITNNGVGTNSNAGNPTINGTLQVDHGTFGYGSGDTTMTVAGTLGIGGADATVNMFGAVLFNNNSTFTMTAGSFNVDPQAASNLGATTSIVLFGTSNGGTINVAFTGGTLTIVDPHAAPGTGKALGIRTGNPATCNFTGGTIRFGNGVSTTAGSTDGFDIDTFVGNQLVPLGNITVNNTATNAATRFVRANSVQFQMLIFGDLTLTNAGGSRFNLNGQLVGFAKDIINNGTLDGTTPGSRLYWFSNGVASNYSGTGTVTTPLDIMDVDNPLGLTINSAASGIVIGSRLNLFRGTITNSNKLTIGNGGATQKDVQFGFAGNPSTGGTFDQAPGFNLGTGSYVVTYDVESVSRTTSFEIPSPSNTITDMVINNPNEVILGGNITVSGTLSLNAGNVTTNANRLAIGAAGTVNRASGYIIGNLQKTYATSGSKSFEVGTANGYSPVAANVTAGTFPATFTASATQNKLPSIPGVNALSRYWTLTATGLTANLTFNYLASDVVGTEANYQIYKYDGSLTNFPPTSLDTANHIATLNGVSSFSDWSLGEAPPIAAPGTLQFSAVTYSGDEGTMATITATRTNGGLGAVSAVYATSNGGANPATGGAACGGSVDYVSTSGTLAWADGDTTPKTFNVMLCGDVATEGTETVILTLSSPTGGASVGANNPATLSIVNTALQFCNNTLIAIPVGGSATPYPSSITVSGLTGAVSHVKVKLNTVQHTWSNDLDILLVGPSGQKLILMSDVGGNVGFDTAATVTFDDDAAATMTSDGVAIPSGSYKPTNPDLGDTFAAPAPGDPYQSPAPAGTATLASVFNGTNPNGQWQLFVVDDDAAGDSGSIAGWCLEIASSEALQFSAANYTTTENSGSATITVNRTGGSTGPLTVNYATSNGTATGGAACAAGVDYITTSGTLNFADGQTSKTFAVPLCNDGVFDGVKTVNLMLSGVTGGASLGSPSTAVLTINDDEPAPTISISGVTVSEGAGSATFVVTQSAITSVNTTFQYSTGDVTATAGADYTGATNVSATITAGATSKNIVIPILQDTGFEGPETFTVTISNAVNATIATATATGTITDDDVPVVYTVNSTNDVNDGTCNSGHCSLREAINAANATPGTITFAPGVTGTITLGTALPGIVNSMTITGPGANTLTVNAASHGTVFDIQSTGATVNITGLTITGGNSTGSLGLAGGINNNGIVTVNGCTITGNTGKQAGGIITFKTLVVLNSTISNNTGIIPGQTLCANNAGGISGSGGNITVINTTISGNTAIGCNNNNNGGIMLFGANLTLTNSTITNNTSSGGGNSAALANTNGTVTVRNSIIAKNVSNTDVLGNFTSSGFNLIGNADSASGFNQATDQTGTSALPLNPMLGPLANNGGTTSTHALISGSPAIDKGKSFGSTTDQRGSGFPRTFDDPAIANAAGGDGSDIGAYEAQPSVPTAVELINFAAQTDASGKVFLEWQTGYEVDNLGFNLYRDVGGKRERVNPSMIAGSALLAGANVRLTAGLAYAWADPVLTGKQGASYWLEDVDLHGKSTWHGPISPLPVGKLPPQADALLLSHLIAPDQATAQTVVIPVLTGKSNAKGGVLGGNGSPGMSASSLQAQWDIAATPGVKLLVRQAGWYRVTQAELVAAGLDVARDPRLLKLFVDGQEIPFAVNGGASGRLEPTDAIEFYGQGLDTVGTDLRTYYLLSSTTPGLRLQLSSDLNGSLTQAQSFPQTIERKARAVYFAGLKNGEANNWFGPIITATPVTQALNVQHLAAGEATLEVTLQGVTDNPLQQPDHQVRVLVNGQDIGTITFDGQEHPVMSFTLPAGLLLEGNNTVTLSATGGSNDVSLIDYVRLTYAHQFTADNQRLPYTTAGQVAVTINGFSSSSLRVMDITDSNNPLELPGHIAADGNGYAITTTPTDAGSRTLYAFASNQVLHPAAMQPNQPSSWNRINQGADVLLIIPQGFTDSIDALVDWRKSQGYAVSIVEVDDLYDEFSYGAHSSQAIVDFLQRAKTLWKKAPRYVVLIGDASQDPRNYLGLGANDSIPTRIVNATTMEAASDDALADFDNDGIAELAIGRLPVRTMQEAAIVTRKIADYERGQVVEGTVIVADRNDGFDFESASQAVEGLLPSGEARLEIFRSRMTDSSAREAIVSAINRGPRVVNYAGHGSMGLWRGNLLTNSDAARMTNRQSLSVVLAMTCLNGLFNDAYTDSLGEALLKTDGGGAVAVWASSALTDAGQQVQMNQEAIHQLYGTTPKTLGEAMRAAKSLIPDGDVRRTWNLLGDPLTKLR